ncbi:MAG: hypothetical protein R3247_16285, partial [Rhodothermales bacterium]|nr:hypothetical protein [Rhodothermales bacterium]
LLRTISGGGILLRRVWGRDLYMVGEPLLLLAVAYLYREVFEMMVPSVLFGVAVFAVFAVLLTRPQANAYFAGTLTEKPALARRLSAYRRRWQSASDLRRLFGVLFLAGGAFLLFMLLLMGPLAVGFGGGPALLLGLLVIVGGPMLIALGLGVWLWGARRWMASLGWTLALGGGLCALQALVVGLLPRMESYRAIFDQAGADPRIFTMMSYAAWPGLALGLAGAAMVWYRWTQDRAHVLRAGEA